MKTGRRNHKRKTITDFLRIRSGWYSAPIVFCTQCSGSNKDAKYLIEPGTRIRDIPVRVTLLNFNRKAFRSLPKVSVNTWLDFHLGQMFESGLLKIILVLDDFYKMKYGQKDANPSIK